MREVRLRYWSHRLFLGYTNAGDPIIQLHPANKEQIKELENLLGGGPYTHEAGVRRGQTSWQAVGEEAVRIGELLLPYLTDWRWEQANEWGCK